MDLRYMRTKSLRRKNAKRNEKLWIRSGQVLIWTIKIPLLLLFNFYFFPKMLHKKEIYFRWKFFVGFFALKKFGRTIINHNLRVCEWVLGLNWKFLDNFSPRLVLHIRRIPRRKIIDEWYFSRLRVSAATFLLLSADVEIEKNLLWNILDLSQTQFSTSAAISKYFFEKNRGRRNLIYGD